MKLIDRIAARLNYEPRRYPDIELVVFRSRRDAGEAGFRSGAHHTERHIRCWYPGMGITALSMRPVRRVTIPRDMVYFVTSEGPLGPILRSRQAAFGADALWVGV